MVQGGPNQPKIFVAFDHDLKLILVNGEKETAAIAYHLILDHI